ILIVPIFIQMNDAQKEESMNGQGNRPEVTGQDYVRRICREVGAGVFRGIRAAKWSRYAGGRPTPGYLGSFRAAGGRMPFS
ncbi:MAG: hypothetical protein OEW18_01110, partial [Candidatus Aminicenantes bacterium]|nr:hypothetical protein [Candidatus Aminicenantes bacterium]